MDEIPAAAWMGIGVFISITSLILGFIRPVKNNAFFQLMLFVGIGMVVFGYIKMRLSRKTPQQRLEEHRQKTLHRGQRDISIDIEDYRKNPQLRQQAAQGYSTHQTQSTQHTTQHTQHNTAHHTVQQHPTTHTSAKPAQSAQSTKFCSECGTPLMKKHKFCPICGTRV